MKIELQQIKTDFNGETDRCICLAHGVTAPGGVAMMTAHPQKLSRSDVFYELLTATSFDHGKTWSKFKSSANVVRTPADDGYEYLLIGEMPIYHPQTGKIVAAGEISPYLNDVHPPYPRISRAGWTVYDEKTGDWSPAKKLELPDIPEFFFTSAGGCQPLPEDDGTILIPIHCMTREFQCDPWHHPWSSCILRCSFDGTDLHFLERSPLMTRPEPRGYMEPSLIKCQDVYYLALRNDITGYITSSPDGLNFAEPVPLTFDDGESVGNYNTQTHWIVSKDRLFLTYTRRGADNDHVLRHRAPIFIAEVDRDSMRLIRSTEQALTPNRGGSMGNYNTVHVSDTESWVVAAELMQTTRPNPYDWQRCASFGADNSIFIAKICF